MLILVQEQGPILQSLAKPIGVVLGTQSYFWATISLTGCETHTGTTPLAARSDALLTAARMIVHAHQVAAKRGCLASTGIIQAAPGSVNTVAGQTLFSLDVRSPRNELVREVEAQLKSDFERIALGKAVSGDESWGGIEGKGCEMVWREDMRTDAVAFHPDCIRCVEESVKGVFGSAAAEEKMERMTSGAGHDRYVLSRK